MPRLRPGLLNQWHNIADKATETGFLIWSDSQEARRDRKKPGF
ncbi:hypothetical protein [[Phormidium] sp. ETS-05]|nr:hypothetical protein [[Phormidium] sp. ETS-05]